jgi:hypothetical protein
VGAFFGVLAWLFTSAFGLFFAGLAIMSLPLNVIAVMHLTGWSWFGALVGVAFFACIPLFGQLGYLVLTIMGAYYLWSAGFDWQKAAYPAAQTFSVSTLSDADVQRFKVDVVRPNLERACKEAALKSSGFDGKLPASVASRCECIATTFAAKVSRDDLIAYEKTGQYPVTVQEQIGIEVRRACVAN